MLLPFSGSQRTPHTTELLATVMVLHLNVFDRKDDDEFDSKGTNDDDDDDDDESY